MNTINYGPMLNAYPDSLGGTLGDAVDFLKNQQVKGAFSSFYILPSMFHTDLDRAARRAGPQAASSSASAHQSAAAARRSA